MPTDYKKRMIKTTDLHLAMETENMLNQLIDFPENPQGMEYFYDLYRHQHGADGPLLPDDRHLVGTACVQIPHELIRAVGATPVRLCNGAYAYDQIGADFLPAKSCPVIKATAGLLNLHQEKWGSRFSAMVVPTTCDLKKKAVELFQSMDYEVYPLEMPGHKDSENGRFYWQESIKKFAVFLQKKTGKRLTAAKLQHSIKQANRASALYRRLNALRQGAAPVIFGKDMLLVANAFFFADIDNWNQAVEQLAEELEQRSNNGIAVTYRKAPRILLTGSPVIFPNLKVPVMIEQAGGIIVADELCSSARLLHDAVLYDEANLNDMVPSVADRYLKPCTCPCLTPNSDRLRRIAEMVKSHEVEGVVYQALSGCLPYEVEQRAVQNVLMEQGIPMLYLETDYSPEDIGQLSTRIEAFLESIKSRRRKKT